MISNVTSLAHPQPVAQSKPAGVKMTQSKPQQTSSATVQVSSAAMAALKEATETPVQTTKEANAGDQQAKRLLGKEAAERAAEK